MKMEQLNQKDGEKNAANEIDVKLQAQAQVFNQIFNVHISLSLKCAVLLGIPDIIHSSPDQSMTLSQLVSALSIHPSKVTHLERLMRLLVQLGFFNKLIKNNDVQEERYVLTQTSQLLLQDNPSSLRPVLLFQFDPITIKTMDVLSDWFKSGQNSSIVPLSFAHDGMTLWDLLSQDGRANSLFNEVMAGDSHLLGSAVRSKCRWVFEGLNSMVDVGGGNGTFSKAIAEEFPQLKCTVFDLPHVVADLEGTHNMTYVAGNMFEAIPPADAILLKFVLHDWSDDECVMILKRCKEALVSKNKKGGGKVIIIDIVLGANENFDQKVAETKLLYDIGMMVFLPGRERNEKEFAKLFYDAGFTSYKITHALGLRSLIEVYPHQSLHSRL